MHTGQHYDYEMSDIQKEAYMLGCAMHYVEGEYGRVEMLEGGGNVLVGADKGKIVEAACSGRSLEVRAQVKEF